MLEKSGFSLSRHGRCCTFFYAIIFVPVSYKMGGKNYSLHVFQHKIYCNRCVCNRIISFTLNGIPLEILYFPDVTELTLTKWRGELNHKILRMSQVLN